MNATRNWSLPELSIPLKALFTGYIMVVGLGLLMAGGQILLTHGMADGKFGVSVDDIVYSYYGNRTGSKLESKLNGSMKDKASPEERMALIKWARDGAKESEWEPIVQPIVMQKCAMCHAHIKSLPNVTQFDTMKDIAKVDEGADITSLTRVSHIHLFGISFIFFFVGYIFSMAVGFNRWVKAVIIFIPLHFGGGHRILVADEDEPAVCLVCDYRWLWLQYCRDDYVVHVFVPDVGDAMARVKRRRHNR